MKVYMDARCEFPCKFDDDLKSKIVVAAGTYFTDNIEKILKLNSKIRCYDHDLIIYLGPFVATEFPLLMKLDCQYTAVELTQKVIDLLIDGVENKTILIVRLVTHLFSRKQVNQICCYIRHITICHQLRKENIPINLKNLLNQDIQIEQKLIIPLHCTLWQIKQKLLH